MMTQDKIWLVRSSGRILGPYSFNEVAQLVGSHEVSILDEIRDPESRWNFVREHKKFAKLVNDIRTKEAQFLDQETEAGVRTKTVKDYNFDDETTPKPASLPAPQRPVFEGEALPKYSLSGVPKTRSLQPWAIAVVFVVISVVIFLYVKNNRDIEQRTLSGDDFIKIAKINKGTGSFEKSLEFYRKAEALGSLDLQSKTQMAILQLEVSNQTLESRKLAEEVLAKASSSESLRIEAQLIQALSYLKESNYIQAEQIFKSILFSDAKQGDARTNLALIYLMKSDFDAAKKEFLSLQKEGYADPFLTLASAFVSLGLNENKPDSEILKNTSEDLERLSRQSTEYLLETQLIRAVVSQKNSDSSQAEKIIADLLDRDPSLTKNHIHNLLIDRQLIRWDRLSMYCDYLTNKLPEGPVARGLNSFCSFQKEETGLALQKIEEARLQYPTSALLTGLQSYYLLATNRGPEAQQLAKGILESSSLATRVYAAVCLEQKDWACAEKAWGEIRAAQPSDVGALTALANIQLEKHSPDRSLDFIKTGLVKTPNYKPLLELRAKIDKP